MPPTPQLAATPSKLLCTSLPPPLRPLAMPRPAILLFRPTLKAVFGFAKREDLRRMANAMNISALLERLRDAYLMSKDSFLRDDGSLLAHIEADVESTFRVRASLIGRACLVSGIASTSQRDPSDVVRLIDDSDTVMCREAIDYSSKRSVEYLLWCTDFINLHSRPLVHPYF